MPRSFNTVVFDQWVEGNTVNDAVYTSAQFNDLLGRADQLRIQLIARNVEGTTYKVSVELEDSNDDQTFEFNSTLVNAATMSVSPFSTAGDTGSAIIGNAGRLKIYFDNAAAKAHIKIIACGRTS